MPNSFGVFFSPSYCILVRMLEAGGLLIHAATIKLHFIGNRTVSIEWLAGARFVVRLWTGCTTFEVFETLPAMKATYAID